MLKDEIDNSSLSGQLSFKVNNTRNTRYNRLFYTPYFSQKCMSHDPINILISSGNNQLF